MDDNPYIFLNYLNKFDKLSKEQFQEHIMPYVQIRRFGSKEIITYEGEADNYLNFILTGLVRKYYKKKSEEFNTQISFEGHIIHSQESFHSRTPSEFFIETIEPTTLLSIRYDDLEKIYTRSKKMEHLGRLVITYTMILKDRSKTQFLKLTPKERFIQFVNNNPQLLQRVPQKILSSYLNIKPETFSRYKHLIYNQ